MAPPRKTDLLREIRHCKNHGLTEFTRYYRDAGKDGYYWDCMKCKSARTLARHHTLKEHPEWKGPHQTRSEDPVRDICPTCWTERTVTGTCLCD